MIARHLYINRISASFRVHSVTALLGPRQCGKTTLARMLAEREPTVYFDLEDPADRARLDNPMQTLGPLEGLVVIDEIQRQVKAPKIFLRDSGIFHALLRIPNLHDLQGHPKLGASREGYALEQILMRLDTREAYFWATHAGAKLDLLVLHGGKRYGFEFKYTDAPTVTRSMRVALKDLRLDHLWVIYPGVKSWTADTLVTVSPLREIEQVVKSLSGK